MFSLLRALLRFRAIDCSQFWISAINLGWVKRFQFPYQFTQIIQRSRLFIFLTSLSLIDFETLFFQLLAALSRVIEDLWLFQEIWLRLLSMEDSERKRIFARQNSLMFPLQLGLIYQAYMSMFSYQKVYQIAKKVFCSSQVSGASAALKSSSLALARSSVLSRQSLICEKVGRSFGLNSIMSLSISPNQGSYISSTLCKQILNRVSSILRPNSGVKSMSSEACSMHSPKMNTSDLRISTSLYSSNISGECNRLLVTCKGSSAIALGSNNFTLSPRKILSHPNTPYPIFNLSKYSSALTTLYMTIHSSLEWKYNNFSLRSAISCLREGCEYWQMLRIWMLPQSVCMSQCCRVNRNWSLRVRCCSKVSTTSSKSAFSSSKRMLLSRYCLSFDLSSCVSSSS